MITPSSGKHGGKQVHSSVAGGSNVALSSNNKSTIFLSFSNPSFENINIQKSSFFVMVKKC